jgi:catechol 2,3-dioxygenase-like lactoylglutathione lyase family enzyme
MQTTNKEKSIKRTIPVLASLDLDESILFYEEKLGFTTGHRDSDYLIMSRDGFPIHFWLCDERHISENTSCYIRVINTDGFWKEFRRNGLDVDRPVEQEWGMKELYVIDPHGNLIKFGEVVTGQVR